MAEYRAFAVGKDGHFTGYEPIFCDTDEQAIEQATRLIEDCQIELWSGSRMVIRLRLESDAPQKQTMEQIPSALRKANAK